MADLVLFVPGFFGFGSFGHPDRPLIEYFARVEDAMLRAHMRPLRFAVHEPPPAGLSPLTVLFRHLHRLLFDVTYRLAPRMPGPAAGGPEGRLLARQSVAEGQRGEQR